MASAHLLNTSARFTFTPPSGSGLSSPFLLAIPLSPLDEFEFEDQRQKYVFRPVDRSSREIVRIVTEKSDLFASIRFDNQPMQLRRLLNLAEDGVIEDLQYQSSSGADPIDLEVEELMGRFKLDGRRGADGEFRVDVHFVLDSTDLDAIL